MKTKVFVALAVTLFLANTAPAGEMDNDRPGEKPTLLTAAPQIPTAAPAAATELDRESPTPASFFFRPFWGWHRPWGWYRPWGFGFNYFYTYSFFYYQPFFPTFGWPCYSGFGLSPFDLWWW